MRLLTRDKIWRAFPELDTYTDEQCARFVQSAKGTLVRRAWLIVLATLTMLAVGSALFGWSAYAAHRLNNSTRLIGSWHINIWLIITYASFIATVIGACFTWVIARDVFLSRRVRHILRHRGVCAKCAYSLIGLKVSEESRVRCPECGEQIEVDPSLSDLQLDEAGAARYAPVERPALAPRFLTPKRVRTIRRWIIWTAVSIVTLLGALWGGWEIFLSRQAKAAKAARLTPEAVEKLIERVQGKTAVREPNGMVAVTHAAEAMGVLCFQLDQSLPKGDSPYPASRCANLYTLDLPVPEDKNEENIKYYAMSHVATRAMYDLVLQSEVPRFLDEFAASRRSMPLMEDGSTPILEQNYVTFVNQYKVQSFVLAHLRRSGADGATATWLRGLRWALALQRMVSEESLPIETPRLLASEREVASEVTRLLQRHPDAATISAIREAYSQYRLAPMTHRAEMTGKHVLDSYASYYEDRARLRKIRIDNVRESRDKASLEELVASFSHDQKQIEAFNAALAARCESEPFSWPTIAPLPALPFRIPDQAGMSFFSASVWNTHVHPQMWWEIELYRRGVDVLLALEDYHLAQGKYPDALGAIVPSHLAVMPTDPITGKPFLYKRIDPATDALHREFLLYSPGIGADNGGMVQFEPGGSWGSNSNLFTDTISASQYDLVINMFKLLERDLPPKANSPAPSEPLPTSDAPQAPGDERAPE